jgi:large subunit ribosomal protein L35
MRHVWRSVVAGRGILHYKALAPGWPLVSVGFGQWSSLRMSKLKSKRAAAKRFRFTGTGKAVRGRAYHRHGLTDQPKKNKVEQRKTALVAPADVRMVKRMLPYG